MEALKVIGLLLLVGGLWIGFCYLCLGWVVKKGDR